MYNDLMSIIDEACLPREEEQASFKLDRSLNCGGYDCFLDYSFVKYYSEDLSWFESIKNYDFKLKYCHDR